MNTIPQLLQSSDQLIQGMSNDEYHARPEYSSSQLKDLLRSAAHFYSNNILKEVERETKAAMNFGTLAHTLFLEPEQFENEFVVAPKFERRTKAGKEEALAWEQANQGKILVDAEQVEAAKRIVINLQKLSSYADMQNNYGMAEASIFFTDPVFDLPLRIRPDWHIAPCKTFPNGLILDLKTTTDARAHAFSKKCSDFGYDLSASMYREGFQQYYQTEQKPDFILLVAESSIPFNVKQYKASHLFLSVGDTRYNKAKELLAESLLINEWDGYSLEMEDLFLPSYMTKQALENDFN
ncbi:PD-(D/E)XK nuclease-like domain-containing protein [Acinetobacter corruptisaponis]|uniref:PD-(D/E)XK nuclease-like domain-containing protein n=1 Tax=Acinetobacter corruptisaponis TaxID=3045147 RepID=A0ABY8S8A5_9GAMM|nr:PD-(D/E)XK nuclease-like domain-containing protein [Acinetobacter sp. KCTC 92772]WHP06953.1 PD-(D/E)XK nuclease-like domain-containing protein [Acinetobacter sp. KCTC 92772]